MGSGSGKKAVVLEIGAVFARGTKSVFKSTDSSIKEIGSSIKKLDATGKRLDTFKRLGHDTLAARKQFLGAKKQLSTLTGEIKKAGGPTKAQRNDLRKLNLEVGRTEDRYRSLRDRTSSMRRELRAAGHDTRNLSGEHRRLSGS